MKRIRRSLEKEGKSEEAREYNSCPVTFVLPLEYSIFVEEFKKHKDSVWIMKPVGRSQGKGIFLFDKLSQISEWKRESRLRQQENNQQVAPVESYVVQRYVEEPLLIGGKKFDLRLYVLVTSYAPLTAYLYRSGFARLSHTHFSMASIESMNNISMHLTNVAVQKQTANYDTDRGGKWPVRQLKLHLISKFGAEPTAELFNQIALIIVRSLCAVQKSMINDKHCFELYGYDILIDANLKPWLLEVNASPALTANTQEDYDLKFGLLDDLFTVLDLEKVLAGTSNTQIGGFDLLYKGPLGRKGVGRPVGGQREKDRDRDDDDAPLPPKAERRVFRT
uniref:Tubulin--tyrosine ligase-like protein 9 n=1 Tax=Chromera velia CCMP2878 TaxID=1169474 RepID=A0A0G4I6S9_9ALVE|eukprot:Cvel_11496.t1-p1 / transcript=Cvel_11496.t1 / gene=Cvel_11496 / organism=Chromera_velia_CCMP2878 / gene_product=Probable tubulin polyglutamylase TTLL9, putative / transcript_product=Probable tubulin polyglutamylase TTLL9, putative / location=Cvel_scaffold724:63820-70459(-) / protein_length=334 / sequence_SO=supercontig / SO=protein_coding / is_pseudo=false